MKKYDHSELYNHYYFRCWLNWNELIFVYIYIKVNWLRIDLFPYSPIICSQFFPLWYFYSYIKYTYIFPYIYMYIYIYQHRSDMSTINLFPWYCHPPLLTGQSLQHWRHCLRPVGSCSSEAGKSGAQSFYETTHQHLANIWGCHQKWRFKLKKLGFTDWTSKELI